MAAYSIREAREDDCEDIMEMVKEFAKQVDVTDPIPVTAEDLKRDGFGQNPLFEVFVAELKTAGSEEGRRPLVGYVLYYYTFNPFSGRCCYMEDFYVKQDWRKQGIGSALWATVTQRALSRGCVDMNWMVLSGNQPSMDFYKRRGAQDMTKEEGFLFYRMGKDTMEKFVAQTLPHVAENH